MDCCASNHIANLTQGLTAKLDRWNHSSILLKGCPVQQDTSDWSTTHVASLSGDYNLQQDLMDWGTLHYVANLAQDWNWPDFIDCCSAMYWSVKHLQQIYSSSGLVRILHAQEETALETDYMEYWMSRIVSWCASPCIQGVFQSLVMYTNIYICLLQLDWHQEGSHNILS